jgi:hypothetical protein
MASPEVNEQCVWSRKCRHATWLPTANVSTTVGASAWAVLLHMASQVSLRVLASKSRVIYAYQTA